MKKIDELMNEALRLEQLRLEHETDTDWADENEDQYNAFADVIEAAYDAEELTADEFNELACIAFYDYDGLKETDDENLG